MTPMSFDERREYYSKIKDMAYYIIIAIVSLVTVSFVPFIGSAITGEVSLPHGPLEWIIFIVTKLCIAGINVILFYCFLAQAKVNVKENKNYIEANRILQELLQDKKLLPRSPKKYFGKIWSSKGITLFFTSLLSTIVLSQAILTFDLVSFLSYLFTIAMALIFGYLQMRVTEEYWITEYLAYAKEELRKSRENNTLSSSSPEVTKTC